MKFLVGSRRISEKGDREAHSVIHGSERLATSLLSVQRTAESSGTVLLGPRW